MLERTPWFGNTKYPKRPGTYEATIQPVDDPARTSLIETHFDGLDWADLPDEAVLVEWRGLIEDPLADL